MSRRVQMIPLFILILCGGISMSSGLYYEEINEAAYVIPVFVISILYYLMGYLFREIGNRELISLIASLTGLTIFLILMYPVTEPGFCDMMNRISTKLHLSYGIDLGKWSYPDSDPVGIIIGELLAFATTVSLYFYEKKYPVVVTALPSFLLFIISIIADGVPYEMCFIVYGAALIIFLGMGRHGANGKKLVVLTCCTVLSGLLFVTIFSWDDVDLFMRGYRDRFIISGNNSAAPEREKDKTPEKEQQTINFGQFSMAGDIFYTGTIELYFNVDRKFDQEALFLRGFIGNSFEDNTWRGDFMTHTYDSHGNAVVMREGIRVYNAYDKGIYVPYALSKEYYDRLMKMQCRGKKKNLEKLSPETRYVDEDLKDQIKSHILGNGQFDTIGDIVGFVQDYFSEGYKYTLHPGEVIYGEDEIEKFLFERRTGYCTHFASASIMIFRTAGIPARLAQGYMVSGNSISPNETTSVYDSNAHAWVEIYVDEEGWIPIDATPRMNRVAEGENATDGDAEATEALPEEELPQVTEDVEGEVVEGSEEEPVEEEDGEVVEETDEEEGEQQDKETGYDRGGKALSGRDKMGRDKKRIPLDDVSVIFLYIAGFLLLDLILLLFVKGHRLYQYARMKRRLTEGDFSKRLLYINDNLKKFWRILGVDWDYSDSKGLTEVIYNNISQYYVFGEADHMSEFRQKIYSYVVSVYKARYDIKSISEEEYDSCQTWLLQLFERMQEQGEKKVWKKARKCNMVKNLYKKAEKRGSNG